MPSSLSFLSNIISAWLVIFLSSGIYTVEYFISIRSSLVMLLSLITSLILWYILSDLSGASQTSITLIVISYSLNLFYLIKHSTHLRSIPIEYPKDFYHHGHSDYYCIYRGI